MHVAARRPSDVSKSASPLRRDCSFFLASAPGAPRVAMAFSRRVRPARRGARRARARRVGANRARAIGARSAASRRARSARARRPRARGRGPGTRVSRRVSASWCASAWDDADRFRRGKNDDAPVEPELPRPRLNSQGVRAVPRSTAANIARARRGAGRASAGEVARVGRARPLSPRRLRTTGKKGKRASSADLARNSPEESLQEVNTRNNEGSFGSPVSDEKKKKSVVRVTVARRAPLPDDVLAATNSRSSPRLACPPPASCRSSPRSPP